MEFGEDGTEIDQSSSDKHLFTEFARVGRPAPVLCMDAANVWPKNIDGVDWVGLAVENQVGSIEADGEVRHVDVADHPRHRRRSLLSGFHQEVLTIPLAMCGNCADRLNRSGVERIGRILRNETAMRLNLRDSEDPGEIGDLTKCINARGAQGWRHQSNGGGPAQEVPFERWRSDNFHSGCCYVVPRE